MPEEALHIQSECILVSAMVHLTPGMKPSFSKFWRRVLYIWQNLNKVCMPSVTYITLHFKVSSKEVLFSPCAILRPQLFKHYGMWF